MPYLPEPVKQSTDLAAVGTAVTINVATLNEWVTLVAGCLAITWSLIRLVEWAQGKKWFRKQRSS